MLLWPAGARCRPQRPQQSGSRSSSLPISLLAEPQHAYLSPLPTPLHHSCSLVLPASAVMQLPCRAPVARPTPKRPGCRRRRYPLHAASCYVVLCSAGVGPSRPGHSAVESLQSSSRSALVTGGAGVGLGAEGCAQLLSTERRNGRSTRNRGMHSKRSTFWCAQSKVQLGGPLVGNSCVQWPQEGCRKGEQEQGVGGRRCSAQGTRLKGRYSRSTASSHSAMSLVLDTLAAADSTNCLQWGMFSSPRRAASCATSASPASRSVRSCLR